MKRTNSDKLGLSCAAIAFIALVVSAIVYANTRPEVKSTRDLKYEAYCDSIFDANPDYYYDVLVEDTTYQNYLEQNGTWWED